MLDLKPFCYKGETRPYIEAPWSAGGFTYATNGHIIVRVPQRDDAPENVPNQIKDPDKVFRGIKHPETYRAVTTVALPPVSDVECDECGGSGRPEHCCTCECVCDECDGSGSVSSDEGKCVAYRGVYFALKYIRMICALPNVTLTDPTASDPMGFRFDGGEGALMALRHRVGPVVSAFSDEPDSPAQAHAPTGNNGERQ